MALKPIRESRGLSQIELALKTGVSNKTISSIERGTRKPSVEVLQSLSESLNCTTDDILKAISDPPRKEAAVS